MHPEAPPLRSADTAVLFLTHQWTQSIRERFARMRREIGPHADCFVLLDGGNANVLAAWRAFLDSIGAPEALVPFHADELPGQLGFGFFGDERILGNTHFPLMNFARDTRYRYLWQVESDVELRGNWREFLAAYDGNDASLLATHFHRPEEWPTWHWWHSLWAPAGVQVRRESFRKAFFPVHRIAKPALDAIAQAHRDGWRGHFEVLVPTVLLQHGHRVEDLRAERPCYVGDSQNPCPILPVQSTMRWRPEIPIPEFMRRGEGPLLFHPVKKNWAFDGEKIVQWPEPAGWS